MNPTGDPELDALKKQRLEKEFARIQRNADRRVARENAKGKGPGSPAAGSPGQSDADGVNSNTDATPQKGRGRNKDGTARKCANCGQVGHIKTNRKSVNKVSFLCLICDSDEYEENGDRKRKGESVAAPRSFVEDSYSKFML